MEADHHSDPDECARGITLGLTNALEEWFDGQIQASRKVGSQPCPGEEVCQVIGPLAKYPDAPVEEICGGCAKKETKPGQQPRRLADAIAEAISLDEIKACGGTFAYPDSLTAYQWSCIRSLERARQKDQEREQRKQQQQSEQAALQARMKSRMGG